jgi:hypothetical protein
MAIDEGGDSRPLLPEMVSKGRHGSTGLYLRLRGTPCAVEAQTSSMSGSGLGLQHTSLV